MSRALAKTIQDLKPGQYGCRLLPFEWRNGTVRCSVYPENKAIPYGWMLVVDSEIYRAAEKRVMANVTARDVLEEMKSREHRI